MGSFYRADKVSQKFEQKNLGPFSNGSWVVFLRTSMEQPQK